MDIFLDLFFPKLCYSCRRPGSYLCLDCTQSVPRHRHICLVCRQASYQGLTHYYCQPKTHLAQLFVPLTYSPLIRKMINDIKLKKASAIASDLLSIAITPQLISILQKQSYSLVTYIPTHPHKLRLRGFNLSEIFARKLSLLLNVPIQSLLQKNRPTTPQSELTAIARTLNLTDAFHPTFVAHSFQNSKILLVDDILTTGTTLEVAAGVLQKSYTPSAISAFVLCAK